MNTRANYFKIGIFIITAVTILVVAMVALGAGALFRQKVMVETYLDESVQGLDVGSPVKYRGVQIGKVDRISHTYTKYEMEKPFDARRRYVLVEISVFADAFEGLSAKEIGLLLARWVERGLRVRLAAQGLTGLSYLEMDYVDDPARYLELKFAWEPTACYVPSAPSTVGRVVESIESINRTLKELERADIPKIADNLDQLLVVLKQSIDEARVAALHEQAIRLLEESREAIGSVREFLDKPDLDDALAGLKRIVEASEDDVAQITSDLRQVSARLNAASEDMPQTVDEFNKTLRRLSALIADRRYDIASILENMETVSANLKELTEDAKRYPAHVLFGEPPAPSEPAK